MNSPYYLDPDLEGESSVKVDKVSVMIFLLGGPECGVPVPILQSCVGGLVPETVSPRKVQVSSGKLDGAGVGCEAHEQTRHPE